MLPPTSERLATHGRSCQRVGLDLTRVGPDFSKNESGVTNVGAIARVILDANLERTWCVLRHQFPQLFDRARFQAFIKIKRRTGHFRGVGGDRVLSLRLFSSSKPEYDGFARHGCGG